MKFLLDVHIAATIGRALMDRGHDVLRASDGYADWADDRLLELAIRDKRVLVTEDRDFSDIVYGGGARPPPAILYLRYGPSDQPNIIDRVLLVVANTKLDGHMVVVQPTGIRYRPLPKTSNDHA